ncbi:RNA degradosome polyphosphate kinase [Lacrimispora sp. NSJ-141]|uniref:Polyphosphate kinase n=1 Tax=Lientehia hominis TaxID=2897778 RepID=A0AAP2RHE6_9FIRM|nr:RNA degradosome polyphosphate kinase [Lientehia hominis]MCD2491705.1 RNA degradosome polyphosphate kinase [Lientehia hominis]
MAEGKEFQKSEYFQNRELSWLQFNIRVLGEARDKSNLLFERLKFLAITASNLDEFVMVRVASLKDMVHADYTKKDIAGMTPREQLEKIGEGMHKLVDTQYSTWNRSLLPLLKKEGLVFIARHELMDEEQKQFADRFFETSVYPVVTPMAVDSSRPFPLIRNKTLNIAALLKKKKGGEGKGSLDFATVQVPAVLPRIIELPGKDGVRNVILLEEIIERNMSRLFLNYDIVCAHPYRIMRNADLPIDEEEAEDLLKEIERQLKRRQWGEVIRLEVEESIDKRLLKILKKEFVIRDEDIFTINGPLDLTFLMKLYGIKGFDHLRQKSWVPQAVPELANEDDIFTNIKKGNIFLHHPYESFDPVVDFVRRAASDPQVLAIKQTLYRVSGNSPIVAALAKAAENGKQVSVLVELKARFDEENNIIWAKKLEQAGCHVIYGLLGLKTHCKICLVVRKEEEGICRYVHMATGNYNDSTAKLYTDTGIMTCDKATGEDASAVFNMLSGYSEPLVWNKLSLAPLWLKNRFVALIEREIKWVKKGHEGRIIAKMNSLCDPVIIQSLYKASAAGVKIDLIVRGICCLKVGIPGISDTISVRSIVGTFLEHSRIFYFENGGDYEIYMGSADWMPRNLDCRVELLFPVEVQENREKVLHILEVELEDNVKAHVLLPDDTYEKPDKRGKILVDSQSQFCAEAVKAAKPPVKGRNAAMTGRVFVPRESPE